MKDAPARLAMLCAVLLACCGGAPIAELPLGQSGSGTYRLAGRVTDSAGWPVEGAEVSLGEMSGDVRRAEPRSTRCADDGTFEFVGVTMGNCQLAVQAAGYATTCRSVPSGDADLALTLWRPASISGVVVDAAGLPTRAEVSRLSDRGMWGTPSDATDESGAFRYDGRTPGSFHIRALTKSGEEADLLLQLAEGAQHHGLRLQVGPPRRSWVRLRTVDHGGKGVAAEELSFTWSDGRPRIEPVGQEVLAVYDLPPGSEVTLRVQRGDEAAADLRAKTASSPDSAPAELTLPQMVPVRFESEPHVDRLGVGVWRGDWEIEFGRTPQRLSPACSYDVRFEARGYLPHIEFDWRPSPEGSVLRVPLKPAATVTGTVVDLDGRPLPSATVKVGGVEYSTPVSDDGTFSLDALEPGEQVICADVAWTRVAATRVRAVAGVATDIGNLVAQRPRRVAGRIRDESGRPIGGAQLTFVTLLRGGYFLSDSADQSETYSHHDGRFAFEVPGVAGTLIAHKQGFGTTPVAWPEGEPVGLEVVLPRPALLRVSALPEPEWNDTGWTCSIRWPDGTVWDIDEFLPCDVEVAPGAIEVLGHFQPYRIAPYFRSDLGGTRTRSILAVAGETFRVEFER